MKTIRLSGLAYEMLLELSKRARKKPEEYVIELIEQQYKGKK